MRQTIFLASLLLSLFSWAQSPKTEYNQSIEVWIESANEPFRVEQNVDITTDSSGLITLYLDQNAWYDERSYLHRELLNNQNEDLHFEQPSDKFRGTTLRFISDRDTVWMIIGKSEMTSLTLAPNTSYHISTGYYCNPPPAEFTGEGQSDHGQALNRPFFRFRVGENPPLLFANAEGFTADIPVLSELTIHNPNGLNLVLPNGSGIHTEELIHSTQYSGEPTFFTSNLLFNLQSFGKNDRKINWLFESDAPPVSEELTVDRLANYIHSIYGEIWPDELNVFVVKKKGALRSRPGLLVVEHSSNDAIFESRVIESFIESLYARELYVNELESPWLVTGTAHYHRYDFLGVAFPEEKLFGDLSNSLAARFLDVEDLMPTYFHRWLYLYMARQGLDQPLSDSAFAFSPLNIEAVVKGKAALMISTLRGYAGNPAYIRGMKRFLENERGSVTSPESYVASVQYFSNVNLDWFFGDAYTTIKKADYDLIDVDQCSYMVTADIQNHGDLALPYSTLGYSEDGQPVLEEWHEGFTGSKRIQLHTEYYSKVVVDAGQDSPDLNAQDHMRKPTGLFQAIEPIRLNFYTGLDQGDKTQIYWLPSLKFNAYDGVLAGVSFYNKTLLPKKWEYKIVPEYSTRTGQLTGAAAFRYYQPMTSGLFHAIEFGVYTRYYHYDQNLTYARISPGLNFHLRKSYPRSTVQQTIKLRGVGVDRQLSPEDALKPIEETNARYWVTDLRYIREEQHILHPSLLETDLQISSRFARFSMSMRQRYMLPNKQWLGIRVFAGAFLFNNQPEGQPFFSFGLSGTQDYLFDYSLIGRSDSTGIWSQQFFVSDGGFKTATNIYSSRWMFSTSVNVPIWKGIGVFGDFGYSATQRNTYWDYGVRLCLIPDFLEVYFPIQSNLTTFVTQPNYFSSVRFILNVNQTDIVQRARRGWY